MGIFGSSIYSWQHTGGDCWIYNLFWSIGLMMNSILKLSLKIEARIQFYVDAVLIIPAAILGTPIALCIVDGIHRIMYHF